MHFVSQRLLAFVLLDFPFFQTWGHFLTIILTLKKSATGKMEVFEGSFHIPYVHGYISICLGLNPHMSGVKPLYPLTPIPYGGPYGTQY